MAALYSDSDPVSVGPFSDIPRPGTQTSTLCTRGTSGGFMDEQRELNLISPA